MTQDTPHLFVSVKIVGEGNSVTSRDLFDFMLTIAVEGCPPDLRLLIVPVEFHFLTDTGAVTDA